MATSEPDRVILLDPSSPHAKAIIAGITDVHAACVLNDHTLATFLPPLRHDVMYPWWEKQNPQITNGERATIVCLSAVSSRTRALDESYTAGFAGQAIPEIPLGAAAVDGTDTNTNTETETDTNTDTTNTTSSSPTRLEVSGVVSLRMPFAETGPFRGIVQKLFVSPLHRRKGIARRMMARLEEVALHHGRWNLMLDTTVGTDAEHVYPRLGYERMGVCRNYGLSPKDGSLVDEVWYWKDLRGEAEGGHGSLARRGRENGVAT